MKKFVLSMLAVVLVACTFSSCSKDDDPTFDYPMEMLVGTWRITHVEQKDGTMADVTASETFNPTYATFNSDGTYIGRGQFGDGTGTFQAIGKTVTCSVSGQEVFKYDVLSLSGSQCELKMYNPDSNKSIKIRCQKL